MDSAEILASLQHPVFVTDASKSLSYINECARHTLGLPSSAHLTLEDVLQKLMTKEGAPLTREALGGIAPLRVSLSSDDFLRVDAVLNAHTLSDHSTCYELNLFQNGTSTAIDPLTGLMDRGHMLKLIGTKRREGKGALILIDIDRLKIINDFLGYDVGDHVIHALGHAFRQQIDASVSLARWSGHEFMALVPENLIQQTAQFAESFNTIARELPLARSLNLPGRKLGLSIGYTRFDSSNPDTPDPLTEVNAAVYEAKRAGRNRAIDARQLTRPSIYITGGALETALLEERIVAAVQPIFDLETGQIVADESLARMITQEGDVIAAGEFIEAAASLQLAHRIDESIIKQTINYCVTSHFSAPRAHFVNISGDFLHHPELIEETIVTAMNACACTHPDQASARQTKPLVIEITERELVDDTQEALRALQPLLDFGLRLALDDFGSGYSSYRYLLDLPFSFLKVEGELIRHITTNDKARRIVQHIQHMAQDLGLITVAEFITDQATADMLAQMGVDWGQGFHLGKPELIQKNRLLKPKAWHTL